MPSRRLAVLHGDHLAHAFADAFLHLFAFLRRHRVQFLLGQAEALQDLLAHPLGRRFLHVLLELVIGRLAFAGAGRGIRLVLLQRQVQLRKTLVHGLAGGLRGGIDGLVAQWRAKGGARFQQIAVADLGVGLPLVVQVTRRPAGKAGGTYAVHDLLPWK